MKTLIISFVMLFGMLMVVTPSAASAQVGSDSVFNTLDECQEAYDIKSYRIYQSRYRGNAKLVAGYRAEYLSGDYCVKQVVAGGRAMWTIQDSTIQIAYGPNGQKYRRDCGNKIYEMVELHRKQAKVIQVEDECPEGTEWNDARKKCIRKIKDFENECPEGTELRDGKCKKMISEMEYVCPDGYEYDERTEKCVIMARTAECPPGQLWDIQNRQCVKKKSSKKWLWIAGIAGAATVTAIVVHKSKSHKTCPTCPTIPAKIQTSNTIPERPTGWTGVGNRIPGGDVPISNLPGTTVPTRPRRTFAAENSGSSYWQSARPSSSSSRSSGYKLVTINGLTKRVPL